MVVQYFEAVYRTPACRVELRQRAKGIVEGFWRLYTDDFYNIRMPVPPIAEQKQIIERLDSELRDLNTIIDRTGREIEFIREYRVRLTADLVLGRLDVRNLERQTINPVAIDEALLADDDLNGDVMSETEAFEAGEEVIDAD